jgi:hypothetical protein
LAIKWARNLFELMEYFVSLHHCNVYYLGCGVAPGQKSLHPFIHFFNGALLTLVKNANIVSGKKFPRFAFHDIYTPIKHSAWVNTTSATERNEWSQEPSSGWLKPFWEICENFVLHQCHAAAEARRAREKSDPKFSRLLAEATPVKRAKKKTAAKESTKKKNKESSPRKASIPARIVSSNVAD